MIYFSGLSKLQYLHKRLLYIQQPKTFKWCVCVRVLLCFFS